MRQMHPRDVLSTSSFFPVSCDLCMYVRVPLIESFVGWRLPVGIVVVFVWEKLETSPSLRYFREVSFRFCGASDGMRAASCDGQ